MEGGGGAVCFCPLRDQYLKIIEFSQLFVKKIQKFSFTLDPNRGEIEGNSQHLAHVRRRTSLL